jgi:serine/threonine protein kinase
MRHRGGLTLFANSAYTVYGTIILVPFRLPMSEQVPESPAEGSNGEPAFAEPKLLSFERLVGNGAPNSDDSPTIISKSPPTQNYFNFNSTESASGSSFRGRSLAHFELIEPIGVGGMAAVLRARDKLLDRFVALKILPPEMATDPEHVQRFHQEARAAAKLDHENIARVYYCGEDQKLHFIAFEFVEGQNLRTLLERQGRLPVKDAVHYLLQIATGVAHAASRGVVHRDIKPSNIIIMPNGRAKLVDMGLARSLAPHDNRQLTQSGVTLGTFDYISPEQALEPRDADVRSDIYSLGCTFYHMLTGQPSVPEGTAAKKLHHHQHVPPIDPRQINPEIPDEVAAILQRMMAKDPKDRYQRAEHLVQHLIQVAQKIGGRDVPEGVFFVDAPLPSPPRQRPVVLACIAVAALGAFVLAVAVTTPRAPIAPSLRPKTSLVQGKEDLTGRGPASGAPKETAAVPETRKVADEKEFTDALAEDRSLKIILQDDIQFSDTGPSYHGGTSGKRNLIVESEDPQKPATLQFAYFPESESPKPYWAGLLVENGTVHFRNVRFAMESGHTPRQLVASLVVTGGQVVLENCTFMQQTPHEELISRKNAKPIASVAAWNPSLKRSPLVFRHCYFSEGQAAVSVVGSAKIEQEDCAFGPHACLFHLWSQEKDDQAELRLSHVSAHVVRGPVFRLDDNVHCALEVQYSIFACPDNISSFDRPDLIRQTGLAANVRFDGKRNAYHQLSSYWTSPGETKDEIDVTDWQTFKKRVATGGGSEVGSTALKASPWQKPNPGPKDDPKVAFTIDQKQPELRLEKDKIHRPIGVESCIWGPLYPAGLSPLEPSPTPPSTVKLAPHERLVDPSGAITGERVHKKVEAAISEAEPDDIILIKHNGELRMEPTALTETRRLKLRPFADYQPILVLGKSTEKATALFHLHHSQIEFEHLEFVLRPDANLRRLAVATMGADSICRFEQCVLTLDNVDNSGVDLDAVTLLDLRDAIKTGSREPNWRADVKFMACFVRGRGDLVGVLSCRPLDLYVDGSLVCLAGSLLNVRPQGGDPLPTESGINLRLNKATAYLAEPALHLVSGKQGRGLSSIQVNASRCLFAAAAARPLVRLEGPENESQFKKLLNWSGITNAFSGFEKLLELVGSDAGTTLAYQSEDWKRFSDTGPETRFDRGGLPVAGGPERDFTQLLPNHFTAGMAAFANFGAPLELLPRPFGEAGGHPSLKQ